jgi:hypothetical protein
MLNSVTQRLVVDRSDSATAADEGSDSDSDSLVKWTDHKRPSNDPIARFTVPTESVALLNQLRTPKTGGRGAAALPPPARSPNTPPNTTADVRQQTLRKVVGQIKNANPTLMNDHLVQFLGTYNVSRPDANAMLLRFP